MHPDDDHHDWMEEQDAIRRGAKGRRDGEARLLRDNLIGAGAVLVIAALVAWWLMAG